MKKSIALFTIIVGLAFSAFGQGPEIGSKIDSFRLKDTSGKEHTLESLKGKNGAVIMFLSAQCPVVKLYISRINELSAEYKAKGINFIGINSNNRKAESLEWVASDAKENFPGFPMLIDEGNVIADKLNAKVTPEAYYVNGDLTLVYHGAIDDDRTGKNISERLLSSAFTQALAGQKVERSSFKAFGCTIKRVQDADRK
jgi:peroxiredoxin